MATNKQTPMQYKRDKGKTEICGNPKDVKGLIWFDVVASYACKIGIPLATIILIFIFKASLPFEIMPLLYRIWRSFFK